MADIYSFESAFLMYGILLQLFFAFMTFFISFISYKVYKITNKDQSKAMSVAFLLIFISYAIQAFFNLLILIGIEHEIFVLMGIHPLSVFNNFGVYFHMLFMTIGLAVLTYTLFRTSNSSVLWYLILSSLMILFLSRNALTGFFMLTSLYLGFLSYNYFMNFLRLNKSAPLLIALGFFFMFLGHIEFLFAFASNLFYIFAHISTALGYSLLLVNYYIIRK